MAKLDKAPVQELPEYGNLDLRARLTDSEVTFLENILACPACGCIDLKIELEGDSVNCPSCRTEYPIIGGVLVMFTDEERRNLAIDFERRGKLILGVRRLQAQLESSGRFARQGEISKNHDIEAAVFESCFHLESGIRISRLARPELKAFLKSDDERGGYYLKVFKELRAKAKGLESGTLLNLGCGQDPLLEEYTELGLEVIEQDIAIEKLLDLRLRGAKYCICCDARSLPLRAESVRFVIATSMIHHVWPIVSPISEISRVLVPEGTFIGAEPSSCYPIAILRELIPSSARLPIIKALSFDSGCNSLSAHSPYEKRISPTAFRKQLIGTGVFPMVQITYLGDYQHSKLDKFISKLVSVFPILSSGFMVRATKHVSERIQGAKI